MRSLMKGSSIRDGVIYRSRVSEQSLPTLPWLSIMKSSRLVDVTQMRKIVSASLLGYNGKESEKGSGEGMR